MRRAATGQPLAAPPAPAPPPPPKPRPPPPKPPPKPPRPPVKHPEGPAGTIERAVAATFPLESFGPVAWMQSPTARSLAEATFDSDTVTVVGRVMVCAAPVAGCRVTEGPFTAVTLPAAPRRAKPPGPLLPPERFAVVLDEELFELAEVPLPHAARASTTAVPPAVMTRRFIRRSPDTEIADARGREGSLGAQGVDGSHARGTRRGVDTEHQAGGGGDADGDQHRGGGDGDA